MTEDMIDLGRRAVACKGWRWMEGMRAESPNGMMSCRVSFYDLNRQPHMLPDLTDPATLGCLLALVREAWGDPRLACVPWRLGWAVDRVWQRDARLSEEATETEALVAALEAA